MEGNTNVVVGWHEAGEHFESFRALLARVSEGFAARVEVTEDAAAVVAACVADPNVRVLIVKLGNKGEGLAILQEIRKAGRSDIFCIVFSITAARNVRSRDVAFRAGANMVSLEEAAVRTAMLTVQKSRQEAGTVACPFCTMRDLTAEGLYYHLPLYHITEPNIDATCTICQKTTASVQVHVHNSHIPASDRRIPEDKSPIDMYSFAMIMVRRSDGKFLLVQEYGREGFWMPGGRIERGERATRGAVREGLEEAGIEIEITGILSFQLVPRSDYTRLRIIFTGKPKHDDAIPKSVPDFESAGASWATIDEMEEVPLRDQEPLTWAKYLEAGGTVYPLSILQMY